MKRILTLALTGLALGAAAPSAAQSALKFGYIDTRQVIAQAPGSMEAQRTFEQEMTRFQGELEALESELKTMLEDYDRQQVTLSPEVRRQRQEEIRAKQIAFQQRAMELEQQAAERQEELVEPIMQRIRTVIGEIRLEEGYAFIFNAAADGIVAADPALDITELVIARLQGVAQQGGPPSGSN